MRSNTDTDRPLTRKERVRFAGALCLILAATFGCQACELKPPPQQPSLSTSTGVTPEDTAAASFKINVHVAFVAPEGADEAPSDSWAGTGWIGAHDPSATYVVTAGHVCETRKTVTVTPDPLEEMLGAEAQTLTVDQVEYKMRNAAGTVYTAERVLVDDDTHDICVLKFDGDLGPALPIAFEDPPYASTGWYVGAPNGDWGGGFAGYYEMKYSGRGHPFRGGCDHDPDTKPLCDQDAEMFTGPATHGASGSAILVDGRVIGLLNLVDDEFTNVSAAVPWYEIRAALVRARTADAPPGF